MPFTLNFNFDKLARQLVTGIMKMWNFVKNILHFIAFLHITIPPTVGKNVVMHFTVSYADRFPDGVKKQVIVINGQFPGPTIRARIHDILIVQFTNLLQDREGEKFPISVHWHGIEMFRKPWWDGPDGITQCRIPYGKSMQYRFQLDQSGTYWYHSHHNWQYADGFWGLLIVDNIKEVYGGSYSDEFPITVTDWYHTPSKRLSECFINNVIGLTVPDSGLINGIGVYPCDQPKTIDNANCPECEPKQGVFPPRPCPPNEYVCIPQRQGIPVFNVVRGLTYRIRLISTSARSNFNFSIDGHQLTVIEVDGVDTVPAGPVDVVTIWPAQRYSFLVAMNAEGVDNFWIRADMSILSEGLPHPKAILRYRKGGKIPRRFRVQAVVVHGAGQGRPARRPFDWQNTNGTSKSPPEDADFVFPTTVTEGTDTSTTQGGSSQRVEEVLNMSSISWGQLPTTIPKQNPVLLDQNSCRPFDPANQLAPNSFVQEIVINATLEINSTSLMFLINGKAYKGTAGLPMILQYRKGLDMSRICPSCNPQFTLKFNKVVQVVINNQNIGNHPWHLHGHTFWVIGTGEMDAGDYDETRDAEKLRLNGVRRDTTHTNENSWAVLRYVADNPGTWFFHCHINWHLDVGLGAVFAEGQKELRELTVPGETKRVCGYNRIDTN